MHHKNSRLNADALRDGRTQVGNRIDNRLALGIARTFLNQMQACGWDDQPANGPKLMASSQRQRQESLRKIKHALGPLIIGMAAKKKLMNTLIARYVPLSSGENKPLDALAVLIEDLDFRVPGAAGPVHAKLWPCREQKIAAIIEVHAIARIIQRNGSQDMKEILRVMKHVAAWSDIASRRNDTGSWMLPTENGLICARSESVDFGQEWSERSRVVVKTFIDQDSFRIHAENSWRRLVNSGALHARPKLPSWDEPDPEHLRLFDLMLEEGRAWDVRRAHAMSLEADAGDAEELDGSNTDPDEEIEFELA